MIRNVTPHLTELNRFLIATKYLFLIALILFMGGCSTYQSEIQGEPFEDAYEDESLSEQEKLESNTVLPPETTVPRKDQNLSSATYLLGHEDVVQVVVWKDESLTRTVMVRPDGKISLPLVGEVQAAGVTPSDLAMQVRKNLQKYYKEQPEVSVIVTEFNSSSIFVLGEVARPGKYILKTDTTFLQALSLVGGFKEYADTKKIILLRREGAIEKRININYKNLISGKNPEDNLILKAGDTLIIP